MEFVHLIEAKSTKVGEVKILELTHLSEKRGVNWPSWPPKIAAYVYVVLKIISDRGVYR